MIKWEILKSLPYRKRGYHKTSGIFRSLPSSISFPYTAQSIFKSRPVRRDIPPMQPIRHSGVTTYRWPESRTDGHTVITTRVCSIVLGTILAEQRHVTLTGRKLLCWQKSINVRMIITTIIQIHYDDQNVLSDGNNFTSSSDALYFWALFVQRFYVPFVYFFVKLSSAYFGMTFKIL